MLRSLLFAVYFWVFLMLTMLVMIPLLVLPRQPRQHYRLMLTRFAAWLCRHFLSVAGARVEVMGRENIPPEGSRVCIVANHQSYADPAFILGWINGNTGFIGKKQLAKVPALGCWMRVLRCVFIDRESARDGVRAMQMAIEHIKDGTFMAVFPEGTRSKSSEMLDFRPGSLKMALRSGALVLPVTIDGSYLLYEATGRIKPARVKITVHPPIDVNTLSAEEKRALPDRVQAIIKGALPDGNE